MSRSIYDELQADHSALHEVAAGGFPRPDKTRVIAVANQKGGVGKTSTTVNIAAALAEAGLHVMVVDADSQGNASTALGVDHGDDIASVYDVLVEGLPLSEVVAATEFSPTLYCVPASLDVAAVEVELVGAVRRESLLSNALHAYLEQRDQQGLPRMDYVLIDCPPSLGIMTINAFVASNEVLIPMQAEYYALEGLALLSRSIDRIAELHNPELTISMIALTMFDRRTTLAKEVEGEVRRFFPEQTLLTRIPRSVRVAEAPSFGAPVVFWDPRCSGSIAYKQLAQEIAYRGAAGLQWSPSTAVGSDTDIDVTGNNDAEEA